MFRRQIITAALALALVPMGAALPAQEAVMSAEEVENLLTGNTAAGVWDGVPYKSYFGPNGTTIYDPADGDALVGKWRVNPKTGQFESFWAAVGWTAYSVLRTDRGLAWEVDGQTYPFELVEGRELAE